MKDILAVIPYEIEKIGLGCQIYYQDEVVTSTKSVTVVLKNLLRENNISYKQMNLMLKKYLISRNYPFIINYRLAFFGFKYRKSDIDDQRGFVNSTFVSNLIDEKIILKTGEVIETLSSYRTNMKNYIYTEFFRQKLYIEFLEFYRNTNQFNGF